MACWSATASAIEGVDQLWALKSRLDIPLAHVTDAEADPEAVRGWKGWRGPGAHIPGVIVAGTFHHQGDRVFWDVHDPANLDISRVARRGVRSPDSGEPGRLTRRAA